MSNSGLTSSLPGIAVIGMALRFPGANSSGDFWQNLLSGVESISAFASGELDSGEDAANRSSLNYVKSRGIIEGVELFDAEFFGFTAREAELTDPQQRMFLLCASEALEDAGYDPERFDGRIGIFGGAGFSHYLLHNVISHRELTSSSGLLQTSIRNRPDHLTTTVAYKLNLKGPAVTVQTACSSSLVAVHQACQSLIAFESDMVLAGGVSISLPQKSGYVFQEGGIFSPDGHCRPFDADAQGTVSGNGVGIVVLKRLKEAIRDRDHIEAVILGSAIGNDGSEKVGYTAPSVAGQAEVIAEAQQVAGVSPHTITYIEAHGTGTKLGDPVEIRALNQAFGAQRERCAIGSVKSNIGHLDTASGIAGLIKTVLCLKNKTLAPSLHFKAANPQIDFSKSCFFVNTRKAPWVSEGPRRAGVSSFGIGGTNAHAVLEEPPTIESDGESQRYYLLPLSAKTRSALDRATVRLADHLENTAAINLADVAYTLQVGRRQFSQRRFVVCHGKDTAVAALRTVCGTDSLNQSSGRRSVPVAFLFPGQGAQYSGMAAGLYANASTFRTIFDLCSKLVQSLLGLDLRQALFGETGLPASAIDINQTLITQPALFAVEYALAKQWMEWGVRPQAMLGHSVGEYVAACLADVLSLSDALTLVSERARLMQSLPAGAMLSIFASKDVIAPLLNAQLAIASINGPEAWVISGPMDAIGELESSLVKCGIVYRRLRTSHAFHSQMTEPILSKFAAVCNSLKFREPKIPYLSNVTGKWIAGDECTNRDYWVRHLRHTVLFGDAVDALLADRGWRLLEVGPGRTLGTLVTRHGLWNEEHSIYPSMRREEEPTDDFSFLLRTLGDLWVDGVNVNWPGSYKYEKRKRLPLPTYPFDLKKYWLEPQKGSSDSVEPASEKREPVKNWLYTPIWTRRSLRQSNFDMEGRPWLLLTKGRSFERDLLKGLRARGIRVFTAQPGDDFSEVNDDFTIRPEDGRDYLAMLTRLNTRGCFPGKIIFLWTLIEGDDREEAHEELDVSFWGPVYLAQAVGSLANTLETEFLLVSNDLYDVTGDPVRKPQRALLLGPCRVIPQEYPTIQCRHVDLDIHSESTGDESIIGRIVQEFASGAEARVVAYRKSVRWVQSFGPLKLEKFEQPSLRSKGTYLITGGLGGVGLALAEKLAENVQARLVLLSRSKLPKREQWSEWLVAHAEEDRVSLIIKKLIAIEGSGAEVLVLAADICDEAQLVAALDAAKARFGAIHGVVHAAGVPGGGVIQRKTPAQARTTFAPKVKGTSLLSFALRDTPLDFFVLCSSRTSILGGFGQADYCAASAFLDAFAAYCRCSGRGPVTSVNWDAWRDTGMLATQAAQLGIRMESPRLLTAHPFLHRRIEGTDFRDVYECELSPDSDWILNEHRILKQATLPGTAYLEILRAALQFRSNGEAIELRDVYFLSPLRVGEGEKRVLRVINDGENDALSCRVLSRDSSVAEGSWVEHLVADATFFKADATKQQDVKAIAQRCTPLKLSAAEVQQLHEGYGPRWASFQHGYAGQRESLVLLALPDRFASELEQLKLHPALLDRAMWSAKQFLAPGGMYVPFGYGSVRIYRSLQPRIYAHAKYHNQDLTEETLTFDLTLTSETGEVLAEIERFTQRRVRDFTQVGSSISPTAAVEHHTDIQIADASYGVVGNAYANSLRSGISSQEGKEAFLYVLSITDQPQVIVSSRHLLTSIDEAGKQSVELIRNPSQDTAPTRRQHPRPALKTAYSKPTNTFEEIICQVWSNSIGIDLVGIYDNYFELGGDSVQAIQIVAELNRRGFSFIIQQLFEHPTVAELAAFSQASAATESVIAHDQLRPTLAQLALLSQSASLSETGTCCVVTELVGSLDEAILQRAFRSVIESHDVFRLRFTGGHLEEYRVTFDQSLNFTLERLHADSPEDQENLDHQLTTLRSRINVATGPVLSAGLLHSGNGQQIHLLVTVAAIVADLPSVGMMLEDLESVYLQMLGGEQTHLSYRSSSYWKWLQAAQESSAFIESGKSALMLWSVEDSTATENHFSIRFGAIETEKLYAYLTNVYKADISEFLATVLAFSIGDASELGGSVIDVEFDGRTDLSIGSDVSQTIGVFAIIAPVYTQISREQEPEEALKTIKTALRSVRDNTNSFSVLRLTAERPKMRLRALEATIGMYQGSNRPSKIFKKAIYYRPKGFANDYVLDVRARILDGSLQVDLFFQDAFIKFDAARTLAGKFEEKARELLALAESNESSWVNASDFPLAGLDEMGFEELAGVLAESENTGN